MPSSRRQLNSREVLPTVRTPTWSPAATQPWPRRETDDFLMSTGSVRPLEDAYQPISQAGLASAGNVVDTNCTMVATLAKRYLGAKGVTVADGVHDRLRRTAAACLAQR